MYIIHRHYEATEANNNFRGQTQDWYCGKSGQSFGHEIPSAYWLKEFGYKTKASATRGLKAYLEYDESENKYGFWTVKSELVEVEAK